VTISKISLLVPVFVMGEYFNNKNPGLRC